MTGSAKGRGTDDEAAARIWVVDRVEGPVAVMVADDDETRLEMPLAKLPDGVREGVVLRVPLMGGVPRWDAAMADEQLKRARLDEAEARLKRLRDRDPGGDIKL